MSNIDRYKVLGYKEVIKNDKYIVMLRENSTEDFLNYYIITDNYESNIKNILIEMGGLVEDIFILDVECVLSSDNIVLKVVYKAYNVEGSFEKYMGIKSRLIVLSSDYGVKDEIVVNFKNNDKIAISRGSIRSLSTGTKIYTNNFVGILSGFFMNDRLGRHHTAYKLKDCLYFMNGYLISLENIKSSIKFMGVMPIISEYEVIAYGECGGRKYLSYVYDKESKDKRYIMLSGLGGTPYSDEVIERMNLIWNDVEEVVL